MVQEDSMTVRPAFRTVLALALIAALVSACGGDEIDIEEAQAQFCSDVEEYVTALDTYGGLFEDVELTVGDVQSAGDDLEPARETVLDSAAQFREAVEADPDAAVDIVLVDPESIEVVEEAEAACGGRDRSADARHRGRCVVHLGCVRAPGCLDTTVRGRRMSR
jgi:hypothetical protein